MRRIGERTGTVSFRRWRRFFEVFAVCGPIMAIVGSAPASSLHTVGADVVTLKPYLGQQTTITATVNGIEGTFLFDTGEGLSTITPAFADKIKCKPWGQVSGFRMSGERLDSPHCDALKLMVGRDHMDLPV